MANKGGAKGCTTFNTNGLRSAIFSSPVGLDNDENAAAACVIDPETGIASCDF